MKIRILSFLLILVMLFALCACDGEETDPTNPEGNPSQNAGESANKDGQNNGVNDPDGGNTNQDNSNPGITNPDGSIDLPFVPF